VLVGCGVLFLLLGVAAVFFLLKARTLLAWSLRQARAQVIANLPMDATAEDRERFEAAFTAAVSAIERNQMDPAALQALQRDLMRVIQKPEGRLTREEFLSLTESLERLGGLSPPEEDAPPVGAAAQLLPAA
jgi:hypothetical protein